MENISWRQDFPPFLICMFYITGNPLVYFQKDITYVPKEITIICCSVRVQIRPTEIPKYYVFWKVPSHHKDSRVRTKLTPSGNRAAMVLQFITAIYSMAYRDTSNRRVFIELKWHFSSAVINESNLMIAQGQQCLESTPGHSPSDFWSPP